ncbi:MAG: L-histidine N(alpha)-methyltransferase [Acidimicrobiales bacterium]
MSLPTAIGIPIEVHLGPLEWATALRADAAAGLTASPKQLPPTWLYDERGCELFEQITELPEYYPTRSERAILVRRAPEVARLTRAESLVELGPGAAVKTRVLLDALAESGSLLSYVPFDVAESTLRATATAVATEYPGIDVVGVVGDFRRHLPLLPASGRRLVAFLGGTIGNLRPPERADFLAELAGTMAPGDALLLGTDLVKDPARLVAAYDDAAGVTAEFNRNVLTVLNRDLGADFDVGGFDHVARYHVRERWIEMHLRAREASAVTIPGLGITIELRKGETILTEVSAKFDRSQVTAELGAAGLRLARWWTDPGGDYALSLSVR